MTTKKITKRPRKGEKKKFFGITFVWSGTCWYNEYIPFIKLKN